MSSEADRPDEYDEATLMWRRLTDGYKLDDGLTHETLTEEIDVEDEDVAGEVCSQAFDYVVADQRTRFEIEDFERAVTTVLTEREQTELDDEPERSDESSAEELRRLKQEIEHKSDTDIENAASSPASLPSEASTDDRAREENEDHADPVHEGAETVEVPREEFEQLQERVGEMESVVNRDFALLKGSMRRLLGIEERAGLEELPGYASEFSDEHDSLLEHARTGSDLSDGGERLSKIELATTIAKQESVRVSTKGLRGGAIDYPAVRDIADRQYDTELNSGTVYTAFDRLERQYDCFHVTDGQRGPNSKNKQLRAERDEIPRALLSDVSMGG